MLNRLIQTEDNLAPLVLRLVLGLVIFPHGAQKLFGWFGGYGFDGTMGFFTGSLGIPWMFGFMVILIEFFGSISLIIGLGTRISAMMIFVLFIGIIFTVHLDHGFFMNWTGSKLGEGFEYHLLVLGMAGSLIALGSGKLSIDRSVIKK